MKPKILVLDIETSPMEAYVWGVFDQNIGINQIKEDSYIIAWAAKWLDSKEMIYADSRSSKDLSKNKAMIKQIWKLMDEAHIVVGQNSKRFDVKRLNAEFLRHDLDPPSSYRQMDTLTMSKKNFAFPSFKLEYMTSRFCAKHKKSSHKEFSGFELWRECLAGNKKAWQQMEDYNKKDVLSTEEYFNKIKKWDNSINFSVYSDSEDNICKCGSKEFKKNGFKFSNSGKYQRLKCIKCSSELRDKKNLLSKEKIKLLKAV